MAELTKKRFSGTFSVLQRVGRAFMLPIALLPIAGLLLGVGASFTKTTMLEAYNEYREEIAHAQAIEQQKKENVKKANENNSKKGLGNVGNVGNVDNDDFLNGFFS